MKSQLSPHLSRAPLLHGRESMLSDRPMSRRERKRKQRRQRWSFRQKLRWAAAVSALGTVVWAFSVIYFADPVFKAEATLLLDLSSSPAPSGYEKVSPNVHDSDLAGYKTEYALLRNRTLASLVIREHGLRLASAFGGKPTQEASSQMIDAYLGHLEIIPVLGTRLVKIAFSAPDPQLATQIVSAHVAAAIRQSQEAERNGQPFIASLSFVDQTFPVTQPMFTHVGSGLLLSVLLGLVGAGGLLFWSYRSNDPTLKTREDVTRHLELATLGIVPDFSTDEVRAEGSQPLPPQFESFPGVFPKELLLAYHPLSLVPEAYRNIRAELLLSRPSSPPRLLLVTSSVSGEGKTLTALNTGISLAQMGARVLVIDADLRHPSCHTVLKAAKGIGLSEFLSGQRPLAEAIQTTRVERLFFLSAGSVPPNPAELLGSKRMQAALSFLAHMYDYVVVDSPPLGLVSDALLLASLVEGVVVVVNSQTTHYEIAQKALARLTQVRQKVLGVVLNKVEAQSREYRDYYRRYRAYYRQTSERKEELLLPDQTPPLLTATQSRTEPTKKGRKTSRKAGKKEEPQLLENTVPETKQTDRVSLSHGPALEDTPTVHASPGKNEENDTKDVPSQLLH